MSENKKLTKKERYEAKRQEKEKQKELEAKARKRNKLAMWGIVTVVIVGSLFLMVKLASSPNEDGNATPQHVEASDWVKGNPEATVEVLEYVDFQCPACRAYGPVINQLSSEFEDDLKIAIRHFPLERIHPNAKLASQAVEAAGLQDKFWEMHDIIFENQADWQNERKPEDKFVSYAEFLELDIDKFKADLNSSEVEKAVEEDQKAGFSAGVSGTPTFYLNGRKLSPNPGYEEFKALIEQELTKNE